jgi:hypothetical protein
MNKKQKKRSYTEVGYMAKKSRLATIEQELRFPNNGEIVARL